MLAEYQRKIIKSITASDIKEAKLKDRVVAFGVLYDKERLERGLSTENIAYDGRTITAELTAITKEIEQLKVEDAEYQEA